MATRGGGGLDSRRRRVLVPDRLLHLVLPLLLLLDLPTHVQAKAGGAAATSSGGALATTQGKSTSNTGLLLDASPRATAAQNVVLDSVAPYLNGQTFRCAHIVTQYFGTDLIYDNGDGLARVAAFAAPTVNATIGMSPLGNTTTVQYNQLEGANVFLLDLMAELAGFTVIYDVVRLPLSVINGDKLGWFTYTLSTLGYDCIMSAVKVDPARTTIMNFVSPHQPFAFTVVAPQPVLPDTTIVQVLFSWTDPFQPELWALSFGALVTAGLVMYLLEGSENEDDFLGLGDSVPLRMVQAAIQGVNSFSGAGGFTPITWAGKAFNAMFSFSMVLLQAAYTANLAAYFTRPPTPVQQISSFQSFAQLRLPVCIQKDAILTGLLSTHYPGTDYVYVPGTVFELFQAVMEGQCAGTVVTDVEANFYLGPGDPNGLFCTLQTIGSPMNMGLYSIPFNLNTPSNITDALGDLVQMAVTLGLYGVGAQQNIPIDDRGDACTSYLNNQAAAANNSLSPLTIHDLAGTFFVVAMGIGVAGLTWMGQRALKKREEASGAAADKDPESASPTQGSRDASAAGTPRAGSGGGGDGRALARGLSKRKGRPMSTQMESFVLNMVDQLKEEIRAEIFSVPEAIASSLESAMAGGMTARATVQLQSRGGRRVNLELEASTLKDLAMIYACMSGSTAEALEKQVAALASNSPALDNAPYASNGSGGAPRIRGGSGGAAGGGAPRTSAARYEPGRGGAPGGVGTSPRSPQDGSGAYGRR